MINDEVIDIKGVTFKTLEEKDIQSCTELLAHVFSSFDPFNVILGITKDQLHDIIKEDLKSILADNLVTICLDKADKVIACYAGFKLSKLDMLKNDTPISDTINIPNIPSTFKEKLSLLKFIDYTLLKPFYEQHSRDNELNKAIFCDYFCVSDEYFKTNLAKDLAFNFFINCANNGIKHVYGSFFNKKAINLLSKYFDAKIVKEISVKFEKEEIEYQIYLLYGNSEKLNNMKIKF
jgi:hypothetical protein